MKEQETNLSWDRGTVKIKEFKPFFAVASEEKKEGRRK